MPLSLLLPLPTTSTLGNAASPPLLLPPLLPTLLPPPPTPSPRPLPLGAETEAALLLETPGNIIIGVDGVAGVLGVTGGVDDDPRDNGRRAYAPYSNCSKLKDVQ